jgi:Uma2 family endonuclease
MGKTLVIVGPEDHGRRMSLEDFDHAEVREGYRYELGRGVIQVSDVPGKRHLKQWQVIRDTFLKYHLQHPGKIDTVVGGAEAKMLVGGFESERHPDLSVYLKPAPGGDDIWATWVPEIVVEIVSRGSRRRDYEEKPEEYLAFGVKEYWIVDAAKEQMTVYRRVAGRRVTRVVEGDKTYKTRMLRGFELDLAAVFAAAREAAD